MPKMKSFTIDDELAVNEREASTEVSIVFDSGEKRWCFFMTPKALDTCGDWIEGTQVRFHLGVPHMIVVSRLNSDIVSRALSELDKRDELYEHTIPLK